MALSAFDQMVLGDEQTFKDGAGESITYHPKQGAKFSITGVFTEDHEEVEIQDSVPVSTTKPTLDVFLGDFTNCKPQQGDMIERDETGLCYEVADVQPDSHGMAKLMLLKQ